MKIFTESQMRDAERFANDAGVPFLRLMENAGSACAHEIVKRTLPEQRVIILCGKGKNGGDGFVIARRLVEAGYSVTVLLVFGNPKDEDSLYMYEKLNGLPVRILDLTRNASAMELIPKADIIVDAIFGIGLRGGVNDDLSKLFDVCNRAKGIIFSVDLPSGMEADSGELKGECIHADYTLAISEGKICHVLLPARKHCGKIVLTRIGVEDEYYKKASYHAFTFTDKEAKATFPLRSDVSNKGDFGKVLCICGCKNYAGAAVLAVNAALRSGAGLVYAAFPDAAYAAIGSKLTESPLLPMPSDSEGRFAVSAIPYLLKAMEGMSAIVLGCGLSQSAGTAEIVEAVIRHAQCPVILDADGINLVSQNIDILRESKGKLILTPHPGEMSRLCGMSIAQIQSDRVNVAKSFASEYNVTLVLKGTNTVVANGSSAVVYINTTGNSGLAKGGSGDFLAGLIGGFVAQNIHFAAETGVYIHGLCADYTADRLSQRGMLASDCIEQLPYVLSQFE